MIDNDGQIEQLHVKMSDGCPFVRDQNEFMAVISSIAFERDVPVEDLAKKLANQREHDDGVIAFVLKVLRKNIKIVHDGHVDQSENPHHIHKKESLLEKQSSK